MISCILIVSIFHFAKSEWVEIGPIYRGKTTSVLPKLRINLQPTTVSNYDDFSRNPVLKSDITSTTLSNNVTIQREYSHSPAPDLIRQKFFEHDSTNTNRKKLIKNAERTENYDEENGEYTSEGFWYFLQTVQDNLLKYKNTSSKSKMSVLKHLRDHLMLNIREKVSNLWKPRSSNEARGYKEDDYHMSFPSNEGALMTIGFLTFAVFLVKLVIKLVHALKKKKEYLTMATSTTTASSVLFLKRRRRDDIDEETAKILEYTEKLKLP